MRNQYPTKLFGHFSCATAIIPAADIEPWTIRGLFASNHRVMKQEKLKQLVLTVEASAQLFCTRFSVVRG
jgi:hypothetical protein